MADYTTAAAAALEALEANTAGGFVEEYEIKPNSRRVKLAGSSDQVKTALMLEGLAARRSRGLFSVAKPRNPR